MFQRRESDATFASGRDLKVFEIFESLSADQRRRWRRVFQTRDLGASEYLYREGQPVSSLFAVETGDIALFREAIGFPVQLLGRCKPGDILGHVALFAEVLHMESARATGPCRVSEISRDDFIAMMEANPDLNDALEHAATEQYSSRLAAGLELEKHREIRMRLQQRVAIRLEDGGVREVTLENLSLGGFCLDGAPDSWQIGEQVSFEIILPAVDLALTGRVAWRREKLVGLAFHQTSAQHDQLIQMATHVLLASSS